jgi:hypothetical protein
MRPPQRQAKSQSGRAPEIELGIRLTVAEARRFAHLLANTAAEAEVLASKRRRPSSYSDDLPFVFSLPRLDGKPLVSKSFLNSTMINDALPSAWLSFHCPIPKTCEPTMARLVVKNVTAACKPWRRFCVNLVRVPTPGCNGTVAAPCQPSTAPFR